MRYQTSIAVTSLAISVLSIIFGSTVLQSFGIKEADARQDVAMLIAFFFLLASGLFSVLSAVARSHARLHELMSENQQKIHDQLEAYGIPYGMLNHHAGIEGLKLVANKLSTVTRVRNTRIVPDEYEGALYASEAKRWDSDIISAVKRGTVFYDVVSGKGRESGDVILSKLRNASLVRGRYTLAIVSPHLGSFINFKILDFQDNSKEVWFGWRLSVNSTIDEICFRSVDQKLVVLFEKFHDDLASSAESKQTCPLD